MVVTMETTMQATTMTPMMVMMMTTKMRMRMRMRMRMKMIMMAAVTMIVETGGVTMETRRRKRLKKQNGRLKQRSEAEPPQLLLRSLTAAMKRMMICRSVVWRCYA